MFADPQTLTINAVATAMPRMGSSSPNTLGVFRSADGKFELNVRQFQSASRFRREVRLTQKKDATDPYNAQVKEVSASVIITVDEPKLGFTDTELGYVVDALKAWYDATARGRVLSGEN